MMDKGLGEEDDINSILNSFANKIKNMVGDKNLNIVKESTIQDAPRASFATVVTNEQSLNKVNFHALELIGLDNGEFELREVNDRMGNAIYGYFLGKRVAFQL